MKRYIYNNEETPYLIGVNGEVYNDKTKKLLKPWPNPSGYMYIDIHLNGTRVRKGVHTLVAETYIPNPENKLTVNHKDGNKKNNNVYNLEWMTQSENNLHAVQNKLRKPVSGTKVHFAKYTENQVRQACLMIEQNIFTLAEIEKVSGIPVKTIGEIRSKKIWKDISKDYKFPDKFVIASRVIDYPTKIKINNMISHNKSTDEIISTLNLANDQHIKAVIHDMRRGMNPENSKKMQEYYIRHRQKLGYDVSKLLNKDQRSSNVCVDRETLPQQLVE